MMMQMSRILLKQIQLQQHQRAALTEIPKTRARPLMIKLLKLQFQRAKRNNLPQP